MPCLQNGGAPFVGENINAGTLKESKERVERQKFMNKKQFSNSKFALILKDTHSFLRRQSTRLNDTLYNGIWYNSM
jgi:hypothetical protein